MIAISVSINLLYTTSSSCTQGELEGAKPASNRIKCRAKPCFARRAWSTPRVLASRREATIFVPQGGTVIIGDKTYIALDVGVIGKHVDILMTHEEAAVAGVRREIVWWCDEQR